jgi:hypothetical protein
MFCKWPITGIPIIRKDTFMFSSHNSKAAGQFWSNFMLQVFVSLLPPKLGYLKTASEVKIYELKTYDQ